MRATRSRIGILGAVALGLSALAGNAEVITPANAPVQQSSNSNNAGGAKINTISQNVIEARQVGRLGGTNMFAGYGIPPHIYGMHYVRRGTHKRTNR